MSIFMGSGSQRVKLNFITIFTTDYEIKKPREISSPVLVFNLPCLFVCKAVVLGNFGN